MKSSNIFHNAESKLLIQLAKNAELQKQVDSLSIDLEEAQRRNDELREAFYSLKTHVYNQFYSSL